MKGKKAPCVHYSDWSESKRFHWDGPDRTQQGQLQSLPVCFEWPDIWSITVGDKSQYKEVAFLDPIDEPTELGESWVRHHGTFLSILILYGQSGGVRIMEVVMASWWLGLRRVGWSWVMGSTQCIPHEASLVEVEWMDRLTSVCAGQKCAILHESWSILVTNCPYFFFNSHLTKSHSRQKIRLPIKLWVAFARVNMEGKNKIWNFKFASFVVIATVCIYSQTIGQ